MKASVHTWSPRRVKRQRRGIHPAPKQDAITEVLSGRWTQHFGAHGWAVEKRNIQFDPRWLDLAVELKDLELVQALARPGHSGANQLLLNTFEERLKKSKDAGDFHSIVGTMVQIQHPAATDSLIAALEKYAKGVHSHQLYLLGHYIQHLPKEALPKLEALLPTLPEKAVDQLLDHVTQLKNKP